LPPRAIPLGVGLLRPQRSVIPCIYTEASLHKDAKYNYRMSMWKPAAQQKRFVSLHVPSHAIPRNTHTHNQHAITTAGLTSTQLAIFIHFDVRWSDQASLTLSYTHMKRGSCPLEAPLALACNMQPFRLLRPQGCRTPRNKWVPLNNRMHHTHTHTQRSGVAALPPKNRNRSRVRFPSTPGQPGLESPTKVER